MEVSSGATIRQGASWPGVFQRDPAAALLATWFGIGLLPGAPGTWGSLASVGLLLLIHRLGGIWPVVALVLVAAAGGVWASARVARLRSVEDPGEVVVDEVAGQGLALLGVLLANPNPEGSRLWAGVAAAFVLFRALDIAKPPPIAQLERLPGGLGIMCDDLAAGAVVGGLLFTVLSALS